jgi:hypothetical protein
LLEALEFGEGAVVGALDAAALEGDLSQVGLLVAALGVKGEAQILLGGLRVIAGDLLGGAGLGQIEHVGFHSGEAAQAPDRSHQAVNQFELDNVDGAEAGVEAEIEFVVEVLVLAVEDEHGGIEAVLHGVETDFVLAFWGFGPGTLLSIPAIGPDLFARCHHVTSWLSARMARELGEFEVPAPE